MLVFVRDLSFKTCRGYEKYGAVTNDDFQVFFQNISTYIKQSYAVVAVVAVAAALKLLSTIYMQKNI